MQFMITPLQATKRRCVASKYVPLGLSGRSPELRGATVNSKHWKECYDRYNRTTKHAVGEPLSLVQRIRNV